MYKVDVSSNHLIKFLSNMDNNRMLFSTHVSSLSTSSFAYHHPSRNQQHVFHLQKSINILKNNQNIYTHTVYLIMSFN